MKPLPKRRFIPVFIIIFMVFTCGMSVSKECIEGLEMLGQTLSNAPDAMTEEYVQMTLEMCPGNAQIYERVAGYYDKWYKVEVNPEKQAEFKKLSEYYYKQAIAGKPAADSESLKAKLAKVQAPGEFNKATFRNLNTAEAGSTGSGANIDVNFQRNSWKLSNDQQIHLDQLGEILMESPSVRISLEGHTDASGTENYNKQLSVKRAESVRNYLVRKFNITIDRIEVNGFGFERLADPDQPYSRINRRVEVIKLSE